jgi:hypothetical protein
MKYYTYRTLGVKFVYSEEEILVEFKEYWVFRMLRAGKSIDKYNDADIIEDWVTINWAYKCDSAGDIE